MDYASLIYEQFSTLVPTLGPGRRFRKLSENSRSGGAIVVCAIDQLKIDCNWTYQDFSVMVTSNMEANDWSYDWAECYYLFLYLEAINDSDVPTEMLKPPRLLNWLIENFDAVYLLMCCPDHAARKKAFFEFQAHERKERSDRVVLAFKQDRLDES